MKIGMYVLMAGSIFLLGFSAAKTAEGSLIDNKKMTQVGIIVEDIDKAAEAWSNFLGLDEVPGINIAAGHESRPTAFKGNPSNAKAKLCFFQLDNVTIELIEPVEGNSTWQEFLDEHGPGIHHIAFNVDNMEQSVRLFSEAGIHEIQHGGWGTGEYAYMDASGSLELIIELLENYQD